MAAAMEKTPIVYPLKPTLQCPKCRTFQIATAPKTCCEMCGHVWITVKRHNNAEWLEGIENGC